MDGEEMERNRWKLASTTSGEHLKRTLEMYQELGFEVYTEEVSPQDCGECTTCFAEGNETITRVYTRLKAEEE